MAWPVPSPSTSETGARHALFPEHAGPNAPLTAPWVSLVASLPEAHVLMAYPRYIAQRWHRNCPFLPSGPEASVAQWRGWLSMGDGVCGFDSGWPPETLTACVRRGTGRSGREEGTTLLSS